MLVVGNAVLDPIFNVDHYPAEDEGMRASSRRLSVGGNAANTAQVLADLGHRVILLATLAPDAPGRPAAVSRAYAESRGHTGAVSLLEAMAVRLPGETMTST